MIIHIFSYFYIFFKIWHNELKRGKNPAQGIAQFASRGKINGFWNLFWLVGLNRTRSEEKIPKNIDFSLIVQQPKDCLPQRLKSMILEKISSGGCLKDSKIVQKTLILAFEANSALSRQKWIFFPSVIDQLFMAIIGNANPYF